MIDTVVLTIPEAQFEIDYNCPLFYRTEKLFSPSSMQLHKGIASRKIYPDKQLVEEYGYMPRMTLYKAVRRGGIEVFVQIEFSAPKLIYGNNLDELENGDFQKLCEIVQKRVEKMGIIIKSIEFLSKSAVSAIHFSKNIILTDYTTPYMYIEPMWKSNIPKTFQTNKVDYTNDGHAFKFRSNNFEFVAYDKLKDIQQAKISFKRAIDRSDFTVSEFNSVEYKIPFEVIRLEARFGQMQKLKVMLDKLGLGVDIYNFESLFSCSISKQILMFFIESLQSGYTKQLSEKPSVKDKAIELLINNPELGFTNFLKALGANLLINEVGIREFRNITQSHNDANWYRLNSSLKNLKVEKTHNPYSFLLNELIKFEPVRLHNYKKQV